MAAKTSALSKSARISPRWRQWTRTASISSGYDWLTGKSVGEVARPIFDNLREKGYFYQTESYQHVYPHCWRCRTELIFRLVDEWFISMR